MEKTRKEGPPGAAGVVVGGLTIVKSGQSTYVGLTAGKRVSAGMTFELKEAMEVLVTHIPDPRGTRVNINFVPVAPFGGPMPISVRADVVVDASRDPELGTAYQSLTGRGSGIIIPQVTR